MAVNTFVTDTEDPNPLIRALAIRTMGCIRVDRMVDYMEIPLQRTLKDDNPYVRKTAAICVAKLFDLNPEMCVEFGFLDALKGLISDSNPMVVSNALSAIYEIRDANEDPSLDVFTVDDAMVKSLLHCLNECTEWGRITILTTLTDYQTSEREEIIHIVERVVPQLQHVNPSVVLLSIKVILHHLEAYPSSSLDQFKQNTLKKLSAPLVSLVSISVPEAQYVGLKNIRIILEKYPSLLLKELRVFFIRYLDPLYLKLEKLEILVRLASEQNSAILLAELKEYAMEFEPALVSRAIKCIGSVAVKLPTLVVKAVHLLSNLVDQRPDDLVANQTVVVLVNILRRYPGRNDLTTLVVPVILNHAADLTANDALSSYIWLMGECPKYFRDADTVERLTEDVTEFLEYDSVLQLDILTTIVKINLERPGHPEFLSLLQKVLEAATQGCENADVRDRAYIYWRLLSLPDSEAVQKRVVLSKLPPIKSTISTFNPNVLDTLVAELSTVSSVFQKPALKCISKNEYKKSYARSTGSKKNLGKMEDLESKAKQEIINNSENENLLDFEDDEGQTGGSGTNGSLLDELNDLFLAIPQQQQKQQQGDLDCRAVRSTAKSTSD